MPIKAVGLQLFTTIGETLFAVCQVRGTFNFKTMEMELWAGVLQPTCHGRLCEGEDYVDALRRTVDEELGAHGPFSEIDVNRLTPLCLTSARTYGCKVEPWVFSEITLHSSTGGLRLVSRQDAQAIRYARACDRGGVFTGHLVMFGDHLGALLLGFTHFEK